MNTRATALSHSNYQAGAVRSGGLAVACAISIGMMVISILTNGFGSLTQNATAAPADDGHRRSYFPAQFAAPTGDAGPDIEMF